MNTTVICESEMHMLPSEGNIITFAYFHPECFTFPTPYIEALARRDMAHYVEWPYGVWPNRHWNRSEKTIHIVPLNRIALPEWGRTACSSCWGDLYSEKTQEQTA